MPGTPDKVLSRDFTFDVNTGTILSPTWTPLGGLDEDGISFSTSSREVDFMDADDGGLAKPVVIGHGYTCSLKGARMESSVDGTRDPGQAAIEAMQDITGLPGMLQYQITSPAAAAAETLTFTASSNTNPMAGGEKTAWTSELKIFGAVTRATEGS